jgi:hypothetical protein
MVELVEVEGALQALGFMLVCANDPRHIARGELPSQ